MPFITVGDVHKFGLGIDFDFYISEDQPAPGTPPKTILKHKRGHIKLRTERDATTVFDIMTMAIDKFEVTDK